MMGKIDLFILPFLNYFFLRTQFQNRLNGFLVWIGESTVNGAFPCFARCASLASRASLARIFSWFRRRGILIENQLPNITYSFLV